MTNLQLDHLNSKPNNTKSVNNSNDLTFNNNIFYFCKTDKIQEGVFLKEVYSLFIIIDLQSVRKIVIGLTEHKSLKTPLKEKSILYIYM